MKKTFGLELYRQMKKNDNIYLLTGDLGYGVFDDIQKSYPERFLNCGASEQSMVDIAIGLSLSGKIPFVYSITPFLLYRPFESLRTYANHEMIPVKLVGAGRDEDYKELGFSHFASDDYEVMNMLEKIHTFYPKDKKQIKTMVEEILGVDKDFPCYINLRR